MKQISVKCFFALLLFFQPFISFGQVNGDLGAISGNWSNSATWYVYSGGSFSVPAGRIPSVSDTVYIPNGSTVLLDVTQDSCYRLTVEAGGTLYAGSVSGSQMYLDIWGDSLTCNGTIGNAIVTTYDGISFDIQGANCIMSGSGIFNGSHIRKYSLIPDTTNLTIAMSTTLCYGDSSNMSSLTDNSAIYNHESSSTFNITFATGTTTNLVRYTGAHPCNTNIAVAGSDGTKPPRSGTYTINGTLIVSGYTLMSTSAYAPYFARWIINSGGVLETNEVITNINCGGSCPGGDTLYMYGGSLMEITGTPNLTYNTFSLSHNTYFLYLGSTIAYTGAGAQFVDVNLTYANLTLGGTGTKTANAGTLNVHGNLTINSPDVLALTTSTDTVNVGGNWTDWTGPTGFTYASSTVIFNGSGNQTLISNNGSGSTGQNFYNLIMDKSSGYLILDATNKSKISIYDSLTFTSGIIIADTTNAGINVVFFTLNSGVSSPGANNNSFVYGRVERTGNTAFTFPVGKGLEYRPVAISSLSGTILMYAQYFETDPDLATVPTYFPTNQVNAPIDSVSRCEYWTLETSTNSSAIVTLSWDTYSCGVTNPATLLVARDSLATSKWASLGNASTTGTATQGTISSSSAVSFYAGKTPAYTLATTSSVNSLPVSLLSFTANAERNDVLLAWSTASEINNDYFTVEKTDNGNDFENVGELKGAGTSTREINYSFVDPAPYQGVSYYRLKQTDYNGDYSYSQLAAINFTAQQTNMITLFPNPTPYHAFINISWESMPKTNIKEKTYTLHVFDVSGREAMQPQVINFSYGVLQMLDVSTLPKGVYELQLSSPADIQRTSLVKE